MSSKITTMIAANPGWLAVFTTAEGNPIFVPVAAWASFEHEDEGEEMWPSVEAMIADGFRIVPIYIQEEYDVDMLVGIFGPEQVAATGPKAWTEKCLDYLAEIKSLEAEHAANCPHHGAEANELKLVPKPN